MKVNIRKSISRTINTGQYENLIIRCDLEIIEEIGSDKELIDLQSSVTNSILSDYEDTEKKVMDELALTKKSAFVKSSGQEPELPVRKNTLSAEEESEIFG